MSMRYRRRQGRSLNRTAGANLTGREVRGKHASSKRWVSGDNWVECQRCGHDIYASDARYDGYTQGLIVCPKCYDPPHPQDYVRAYEDRIAPAGPVTGAADYDTTRATGSTEPPLGTFISADITIGTIADQVSITGDTISLDAATGIWPTLYDVWDGTDGDVTSYVAINLPVGLSIDATTGEITGTITLFTAGGSPYASQVVGTYASGRTLTTSFTWTVTEKVGSPDTITGLTDWGWWDFSYAATVGVVGGTWQDAARTIPCVNNSAMLVCDDKSGGDNHAANASSANTWASTGLDEWGVGEFVNANGWLTCPQVGVNAPGWSLVVLLRLHNTVGGTPSSRGPLGGGGAGDPSSWAFWPGATLPEDRKYRMSSATGSVDYVSTDVLWTNVIDNYKHFYFEFDQSTSAAYVNNILHNTGTAWPDAFGPGDMRIGGSVSLGSWVGRIMEVVLMDKVLSTGERTALYDYHNNRYGLDGQ